MNKIKVLFFVGVWLGTLSFFNAADNEPVYDHKGAPYKLHNGLDDSIRVEIIEYEKKGDSWREVKVSPGLVTVDLKLTIIDSTDILRPAEEKRLNFKALKNPTSDDRKIGLSIQIYGIKKANAYDFREVTWFLGEGHEPSRTRIEFLKDQFRSYRIIFEYDKGALPTINAKLLEEGLTSHIEGHVCKPGDANCKQ